MTKIANLQFGQLVEYDVCCQIPIDKKSQEFHKHYQFLGLGDIYEIYGIKQTDSKANKYAFFKFKTQKVTAKLDNGDIVEYDTCSVTPDAASTRHAYEINWNMIFLGYGICHEHWCVPTNDTQRRGFWKSKSS